MSLLGIDIGTSGCKAALFNEEGEMIHSAYRKYTVLRQLPGVAELEIIAVETAVMEVIHECADHSDKDFPVALAVSSFGESCVPVTADGHAACRCCILPEDQRAEEDMKVLIRLFSSNAMQERTGIRPESCYSLPLLMRQFRNSRELRERCATLLDWSDYIAFRLSGEAAFNISSASRTLALDVHAMQWIPEYIAAAGLDSRRFPALVSPGTVLGPIRMDMAQQLGLPRNTKIVAGTHDQCAAAIGCGAASVSDMMLGLGSYACAVFCRENGLQPPEAFGHALNMEPHALPGHFASFLFHSGCGMLLEWLASSLFPECAGQDRFHRIFQLVNDWKPRPTPLVLPEFGHGRGMIGGISLENDRTDILRGACEGMLFYFRECVCREKREQHLRRIFASGGGSRTPEILQLAADILELPVRLNNTPEAGAFGSAMLAGSGCGIYASIMEASEKLPRCLMVFEPKHDFTEPYIKWHTVFQLMLAEEFSI